MMLVVPRLDQLDLNLKLSREDEAEQLERAQTRLLQLRLVLGGLTGDKGLGPPLLAVFEGWDAAGKGTIINRLAQVLDPRGFKVHSTLRPTKNERLHPWLWRFWSALPTDGTFAIFDRSWYRRVLGDRTSGRLPRDRERILEVLDAALSGKIPLRPEWARGL